MPDVKCFVTIKMCCVYDHWYDSVYDQWYDGVYDQWYDILSATLYMPGSKQLPMHVGAVRLYADTSL